MKNIISIALCSVVLMQTSCRVVLGKIYGVNKTYNFKSSFEYQSFANKKNNIPTNTILYMDSATGPGIVSYFKTKKRSNGYFLGTYLNDSTRVKESKDLQEDENCWGRILTDLKHNIKPGSLQIESDTLLQHKAMYWASTEKKFSFPDDYKLKIFLFYTTSFGTLFKPNYKKIVDFVNKHSDSTELFVISLDYGDDGHENKGWQ